MNAEPNPTAEASTIDPQVGRDPAPRQRFSWLWLLGFILMVATLFDVLFDFPPAVSPSVRVGAGIVTALVALGLGLRYVKAAGGGRGGLIELGAAAAVVVVVNLLQAL